MSTAIFMLFLCLSHTFPTPMRNFLLVQNLNNLLTNMKQILLKMQKNKGFFLNNISHYFVPFVENNVHIGKRFVVYCLYKRGNPR